MLVEAFWMNGVDLPVSLTLQASACFLVEYKATGPTVRCLKKGCHVRGFLPGTWPIASGTKIQNLKSPNEKAAGLNLKFPNAVFLNAIGHRNMQKSASEHKERECK